MNTFGSITYEFFNNKKNYHFDLTGAFSNIIEESEAIEYDDDDDEDEFDDDDEPSEERDLILNFIKSSSRGIVRGSIDE